MRAVHLILLMRHLKIANNLHHRTPSIPLTSKFYVAQITKNFLWDRVKYEDLTCQDCWERTLRRNGVKKAKAAHIYSIGPGEADIFHCLENFPVNKEEKCERFVSEQINRVFKLASID